MPRVSRWLRGKPSPRRVARTFGRDGRSDADVLVRNPNSQPLAPLLPTTAESLAPPSGGHTRTKSMCLRTPLVTGTVGRLTHETREVGNEGRADWLPIPGTWIEAAKASLHTEILQVQRDRPALSTGRVSLAVQPCFYPRIDFSTRPHVAWAPFGEVPVGRPDLGPHW
jgi:hypothetical protein